MLAGGGMACERRNATRLTRDRNVVTERDRDEYCNSWRTFI